MRSSQTEKSTKKAGGAGRGEGAERRVAVVGERGAGRGAGRRKNSRKDRRERWREKCPRPDNNLDNSRHRRAAGDDRTGSRDRSREAGSESAASRRTAELSRRDLGTAQPPALDVGLIKIPLSLHYHNSSCCSTDLE